ncbi:hypothetical protein DC364_01725 [Vibrio vulnificus]|nr:hypothetical protein DC364_01725 [Vibrio vulnificus]
MIFKRITQNIIKVRMSNQLSQIITLFDARPLKFGGWLIEINKNRYSPNKKTKECEHERGITQKLKNKMKVTR